MKLSDVLRDPRGMPDGILSGRRFSAIFRVGLIRSVLSGREGDAMRAFRSWCADAGAASNAEGLRSATVAMEVAYRNEYFYKNLLANRLLLAPTQSHSAALLTELRFAESIVDAVLVDADATAYEIKTELDSPTKLRSQVDSYKKVLSRIVVVTHLSLAERYARALDDETVGITVLKPSGALSVVRAPIEDSSRLEARAIFNTLRKEEYTRLVWRWSGVKPEAPTALLYEHCLTIALEMPLKQLAEEHTRELRTRALRFAKAVRDPRLSDIRSLCVQLNPTRDQISRVLQWLEEPIDVHPIRERQTV